MASGEATREVDERAQVKTAHDEIFDAYFPTEWLENDLAEPRSVAETLTEPPRYRLVEPLALLWMRFCAAVIIESERGVFFLLIPIFAASGAVVYFTLSYEPLWSEVLLAPALLGVLRVMARQRYIMASCLTLALVFSLGMVAGKIETARRSTQMLGSDVTTRVTGRVAALEAQVNGSWRLVIDVISTERPVLRHMSERIRVSARDLPAQTEIGSGLQGLVRLRAQSGPVRPGNFDFAFNGYFRGLGGNGFFLGTPQLTDVPQISRISATIAHWIATLRFNVGERITSTIGGEEGAVAAALISGQRDGISEATNEALRQAGLAHVLSISGLHLALAAGVIMLSIRAGAALFPRFSARHPIKKYAALASLFSSAFYLALSGADVAAQRSFIMIAVMLLALLADRAAISMRNLAIATLVTITIAPHEVLGPSFQMSFSATAALIAAFAWWSDRKGKHLKEQERRVIKPRGWLFKILAPAGATAMTSLVAGTASGIFAAYHFNNTAPLGLMGNVLALPVISTMIMPFGVLSLVLMPLQLEWLPLQVMGAGVTVVRWIAEFVAAISPDGNPGIVPITAVMLWTVALVIGVLSTTRLRLLSFVFVAAGLIMYAQATGPDVIISDDAKLVAVRIDAITLAVNRSRPARFTMDNWQKAYRVDVVEKPVTIKLTKTKVTRPDVSGARGFVCEEDVCVIALRDGRMLAHTDNLDAIEMACNLGDIVILAVSGKELSCGSAGAKVITKRDLALKGALEIRLGGISDQAGSKINAVSESGTQTNYDDRLTYAIGSPERPWHLYRLYSRAARGLPDYVHKNQWDKVDVARAGVAHKNKRTGPSTLHVTKPL